MYDSTDAQTGWLLLIHQLPLKPDYLRVKVRRRLQRLGAAPLRGSVYVLPDTEEAREDFQWLLGEIRAEGGEAMLCRVDFLDGPTDEELHAMFSTVRGNAAPAGDAAPERVEPGRTWVTRRDVHVDRIASAWLIRRFIDPEARFKFVPPRGYRPEPGELRFDMAPASEYTHDGELCTFQVLVRQFRIAEPGLAAVGEVVRDIDCKDSKYGRPETAGIAALISGIAGAHADDEARLSRGAELFDGLLQHFASRR